MVEEMKQFKEDLFQRQSDLAKLVKDKFVEIEQRIDEEIEIRKSRWQFLKNTVNTALLPYLAPINKKLGYNPKTDKFERIENLEQDLDTSNTNLTASAIGNYNILKKEIEALEQKFALVEIKAEAKAVIVPEGKSVFWNNKIIELEQKMDMILEQEEHIQRLEGHVSDCQEHTNKVEKWNKEAKKTLGKILTKLFKKVFRLERNALINTRITKEQIEEETKSFVRILENENINREVVLDLGKIIKTILLHIRNDSWGGSVSMGSLREKLHNSLKKLSIGEKEKETVVQTVPNRGNASVKLHRESLQIKAPSHSKPSEVNYKAMDSTLLTNKLRREANEKAKEDIGWNCKLCGKPILVEEWHTVRKYHTKCRDKYVLVSGKDLLKMIEEGKKTCNRDKDQFWNKMEKRYEWK